MSLKECLFFPKHGVVYINNPKAGCTTIKRALSGDYETTGRHFHPKCRSTYGLVDSSAIDPDTPCIFICRHPVDRLQSCYKSKVGSVLYLEASGEDDILQRPLGKLITLIRKEMNLPARAPINIQMFVEFVRHYFNTYGLADAEPHFRPQTETIRQNILRPDHWGRLEDMPHVWDQLQAKCQFTAPINQVFNQTKWKEPLQPSLIRLIEDTYAEDMDFFNY